MEQEKIKAAIKRLHEEIGNISDFYDDDDLQRILRNVRDVELDKVADAFVDAEWNERPIRRCSCCGNLMDEGYVIGDEYACCDGCRNEIYKRDDNAGTDEEAYRLYLKDCYMLDDDEIEGMTAEEIAEKCNDRDVSDSVYWTQWY